MSTGWLAPHPMVPTAGLRLVRLAATSSGPALVTCQQQRRDAVLWRASPLEPGAPPARLAGWRNGVGASDWDVRVGGGDAWAIVRTVPKSASVELVTFAPDDAAPSRLGRPAGLVSLLAPRYARGSAGTSGVAAILGDGAPDAIVIDEGGGDVERVWAPPPGALQSAVVLVRRDGPVLLASVGCAGEGDDEEPGLRRAATGATFRESYVGALSLAPAGPRWTAEPGPFGLRGVFEFDAAVAGDEIILFATTPAGAVVVAGRLSDGGWSERARLELEASDLCAPAIAVVAGEVWTAALSRAGATPEVVAGRAPAPHGGRWLAS